MTDRFFTDEELVAYLDGEHDFAPVDDIEQLLVDDPSLRKRLDRLKVDGDAIKDSFDHVRPINRRAPILPHIQSSGLRMQAVAMIACLALIIGGGLGFGARGGASGPQGWKEYVAAYQALYINATLASVEISPDIQRLELKRISAAIGKDISLESLSVSPEISYKRAQILGFEGRPLAQLAFLSSTGAPLALCIIRMGGDEAETQFGKMEDMSTASWSQGEYEYLLIGGDDPQFIKRLAEQFIANQI